MVSDPSFVLANIDNSAAIYLPNSFVRAEQDKLLKSRGKTSGGRIFSDYRQLETQYGPGLEKPMEGLPHEMLRQLADTSPIDRLIIDTRMMQMRRVARRVMSRNGIGYAVEHVRQNDPDFNVPQQLQDLSKKIEELISKPTAAFHATVRDFFVACVEEELTIDRKAMVITRDRVGKPARFHLIDGATIKPVPMIIFEAIQKGYADQGQQNSIGTVANQYDRTVYELSKQWGIDLSDKAYVQMVDAMVVGAWRDDELAIDITNPTVRLNWWGYGRSLLEKSWRLSQSFLMAWNYNNELFKLNYPEAIVTINGAYDLEGLKSFKRKVLGEGDGRDNNWRLPVMLMDDQEAKIEMIKLRDTPKDMLFGQYLQAVIRLKCAAYRMHPSLINFTEQSGDGSIILQGSATNQDEISLSQEEGLHALLDSVADWLTRTIVQEFHKDLRFVWVGLNEESEDAKVERAVKQVANYMTIDEVRASMGLKPLPTEIPKAPGHFIGQFGQAVQMITGQQQADAQAGGPGYEDGDFGSPDGQQPGTPPDRQPQNDSQASGAPFDKPDTSSPQAPQPQRGGPQHMQEEADELRRSMRYLRIRIDRDGDS